jgi:hypothetical protein
MPGLPDPYPPAGIGYSYLDWFGAYNMATAVMAALYRQRKTGEGTYIGASQVEIGIYLTGTAVLDSSANGRPWQRYGNRSPYNPAAPHGVYSTRGSSTAIPPQGRVGRKRRRLGIREIRHAFVLGVSIGIDAMQAEIMSSLNLGDRDIGIPPGNESHAVDTAPGLVLHVSHRIVPERGAELWQLGVGDVGKALAAESDRVRVNDLGPDADLVHDREARFDERGGRRHVTHRRGRLSGDRSRRRAPDRRRAERRRDRRAIDGEQLGPGHERDSGRLRSGWVDGQGRRSKPSTLRDQSREALSTKPAARPGGAPAVTSAISASFTCRGPDRPAI